MFRQGTISGKGGVDEMQPVDESVPVEAAEPLLSLYHKRCVEARSPRLIP